MNHIVIIVGYPSDDGKESMCEGDMIFVTEDND